MPQPLRPLPGDERDDAGGGDSGQANGDRLLRERIGVLAKELPAFDHGRNGASEDTECHEIAEAGGPQQVDLSQAKPGGRGDRTEEIPGAVDWLAPPR